MRKFLNKRKKNTKRNSGFTLAETLIAVLILLMVSVVVATGIPAAGRAYQKVVDSANAELLLSTTITSLRNELATAESVTTGDGSTSVTYYNPTRKSYSRIFLDSSKANEGIQFNRYYKAGIDPGAETSGAERFIPAGVSTKELYVTYTSVSYSGGVVTFSNLRVLKSKEAPGASSAAGRTVSIRVVSA